MTKETLLRLYSKKYNSYADWNGSAWEDKNVNGAYFYTFEKAAINGYVPVHYVPDENGYPLNSSQKHLKELNDIVDTFPLLKPNQKQFKEFNAELFKAYIDKFTDRDLYTAHNILTSLRLERNNNLYP